MSKSSKDKILGISFNQDQDCFACGTEMGFSVYKSVPYKGTFKRVFNAGIGHVGMLHRSNILALIGGGSHPKYPLNKVMLWDDKQEKCIGELSFKPQVKAVKVHKERIVIVLEQRIYVYQFSDLKLLDAIETCHNPQGLCDITSKGAIIVACPDKKKGSVRIVNYSSNTSIERAIHESTLSGIALTQDGKFCAASSEDGKLIRVLEVLTGHVFQELHRGSSKAEIQCLTFDASGRWIICSSDRETIHIFSIQNTTLGFATEEKKEEVKDSVKNPRSTLTFMKGISTYFSSERSFAQFRVPHKKAVVGFGPPDKSQIIVVTYEGKYYRVEFNPKTGGECKKIEEKNLFTDK